MSKIDELLEKLCPDGVKYSQLWELTAWDKKFNAVENYKQKKVQKYRYLLAKDLKALEDNTGSVKLLSTGFYDGYTTEEKAGKYLSEGEVVTIPWGGTAIVKYYKGKFCTADNRIATSLDINILNNKFLYYYMLANTKLIQSFYRGSSIQHPSMKSVLDMSIPVPPLEVQNEIVRILDNFTELEVELEAELEARTKQYEYYRNKLLDFSTGSVGVPRIDKMLAEICPNGVELKSIDSMIDYIQPTRYIVNNAKYSDDFKMPVLTAGKTFILGYTNETEGIYMADKNTPVMIFDDFTTSMHWVDFDFKVKSSALKILVPKNSNNNFRFLYYALKVLDYQKSDGTHERHWISKYSKLEIQVPPLEVQNEIVKILDNFSEYVSSISQGLPAEIAARRKQFEYYRNKLLTF